MNTSVPIKKKFLPQFLKKIEEQLLCGGGRYALTKDKEMTDLVCELAGNDWILGNIVKYCGEYKNTKQVQDLYKISTYAFILYLRDYEVLDLGKDRGENK